MGCDIHLYVEQRQADGSWKVVPPPDRDLVKYPRTPDERNYISPFWGPNGCMYERGPTGADGSDLGYFMQWYLGRSYDTFAILADVRNGSVFKPIAYPRGVPEDVSEFLRLHAAWDHTPTWLSLPEILNYDWSQTTSHCGVIPLTGSDDTLWSGDDNFQAWEARGGGRPKAWSGAVSGGGVVQVTPPIARKILSLPNRIGYEITRFNQIPADMWERPVDVVVTEKTTIYVQVDWVETYAESASTFLEFIDEMVKPLGPPEDIRLVFGFDS